MSLSCAAAPAVADFFTVSNTNDSGAGSLRAQIEAANADITPPHTIDFEIPGGGPFVIALATPLPTITRATFIDASLEAISGAPGVRIDGTALVGGSGLTFGATADGAGVSYLSITNFPGYGIDIAGDSTGVTNCYVGVLPDGVTAGGNDLSGIRLTAPLATVGASGSTGNLISGNANHGVLVGTAAGFSAIRGNRIGTNAAGTAAIPNAGDGINGAGASGTNVGGNDPGQGNLISGNTGDGLDLGATTTFWAIQGNLIGLTGDGLTALPNGQSGILTTGDDHLIGSTDPDGRNVISGNLNHGILLSSGAEDVGIRGNYIGTNLTGTAAVGNQQNGIRVVGTVSNCTIGGTDATWRNVISGNVNAGLSVETGVSGCVVSANYIGTNAAGAAAVPNGGGVDLGGAGTVLGGDTAGRRNVISGNTFNGVVLRSGNNAIRGNYIGTDASGTAAIANGTGGIRVITATNGTIGGSLAGQGNLISGNTLVGIDVDADVSSITISGNLIGTNAAGTAALPNVGSGVRLRGSNNIIGGANAAERNVVSGNSQVGITIEGTGHTVKGNYVGSNAAGTGALANGGLGIRVLDATLTHIGGVLPGEGNLISGNGTNGISLDAEANNITIAGNLIGTNAAGNAAIANQGSGIDLNGFDNLLGGNTAAARNLISGNVQQGVVLSGTDNSVSGNYIGTNAAGTTALGNGSYGVRIYAASGGLLGGPTAAEGNLISGNGRGVSLEVGSAAVEIYNNTIGLDVTQTVDLADNHAGIQVDTSDNVIGGPAKGNVIAGMSQSGIELADGAARNVIQGNWIGTNKAFAAGLGNHVAGIWISDAFDNTIGGPGNGQANFIRHNGFMGVRVERGDGNEVTANSIADNGLLGIDVGPQYVFPNDPLDPDIIGNRAQNYPLVTSATVDGGSTHIEGLLFNEPGTGYVIQYFSSPSCDETGFGEGHTYLGFSNKFTPDTGEADFSLDLGQAITDAFVSATVTDEAGNTSEFSPCAEVGGPNPGQIQFFREVYLAYEGVINTAEVILTRSHGLDGTVSVNLTTSNGTAQAGADYVDSGQLVTFQPLEAVKVVQVPLIVDPAVEPSPEDVQLSLSGPTGGATLGLSASEILIFDEDKAFPGIIIDDASVTEGHSGQKQLSFDVHLSATDHPVTVTWFTEPGTAAEGDDYDYAEGGLAFGVSASEQTQQVSVPINGDTAVEPDEYFWVRVVNTPGGGNWIAYKTYGAGVIVNDDGLEPPPEMIFEDGFEDLD